MRPRFLPGDAHLLRQRPWLAARGERHGLAKLTDRAVAEIREAVRAGVKLRELAAIFGVDRKTIANAAAQRTWKHVEA